MKVPSTTRFLLTVLVLGAATVAAGSAFAAPAAPVVIFRTAPRWDVIPGTLVARVRDNERPDYDLFRYGSRYYAYDNGYWYRSARLDRPFVVINERSVPIAIAAVPHDQWRSYPPGWMNPKNPHYSARHDNRNSGGKSHHRK